MTRTPPPRAQHSRTQHSRLPFRLWDMTGTSLLNLLVLAIVVAYLFPMTYMIVTALKDPAQSTDLKAPIWPAKIATFAYQGAEYPMYKVTTEQGVQEWALVEKSRQESKFVDPAHPGAGLITWQGRWRTLEPVYTLKLAFSNFTVLWRRLSYLKLLRNTVAVTALSGIGVMVSSVLVAYGFARFPVPGGNALFLLVIATALIPEKITLIPTYFVFERVLDWSGTWWPLIVPHFFGSALLIFLLRQNFKNIPRDLEEAAMLDGAGSLRILLSVILPLSRPVLITTVLLHFFYAWNEIRLASLYLGIRPDLYTLAFGVQRYQGYGPAPTSIQASALMAMVVPVVVLFLTQRVFMQHVRVTGLEK